MQKVTHTGNFSIFLLRNVKLLHAFDESMRTSILVGMMTTLAMSLFVVAATTTGPFNILPVNADPDGQAARDFCDDFFDSDSERKCKQEHDD